MLNSVCVCVCVTNFLFYLIHFFLFTFYFIEKGKLKHATVSPEPRETKNIRSFKVSHLFSLYIILFFIM